MKCGKSFLIPVLGAVLLAGCEQTAGPDATGMADTDVQEITEAPPADPAMHTRLPALFDCVREEGGILLAAHRGGPMRGYPENALETLEKVHDMAAFVMEVDVAESRDGVLFLMHDDTLDRTTTGTGEVSQTDWAEIEALNLVDNNGTETTSTPPKLSEALDWAVENDAILELDRKRTTEFAQIIEAVREAGAESNVILITYNDDQASEVARLAPELMMTAGVRDNAHEDTLIDAGVAPDRLIAWTGTSSPMPGQWQALAEKDIESAFGTLGRPGERLDDQYWADGDPSEYSQLAEGGLTLLATDTPYKLAYADGKIGTAQDVARKECMRAFMQ